MVGGTVGIGPGGGVTMRRWIAALVSFVVVAAAGVFVSVPASAADVAQSTVVNADPVNNTPHVLDGEVDSIAQVGDTVILGGSFTQVSNAQGTETFARRNLVAFDAATGQIRPFNPSPDGQVTTVIAAADGRSVYIGGSFNTVNGETRRKLARVDVTTGANVSGFRNVASNGIVRDLRLIGTRLWVAGAFTTMTGSTQGQLVTLNASTGVPDGYMTLAVAGRHNGGTTAVHKIDVSADGTKLVGIGNFLTVNGQDRRQIFMLDISGGSPAVADWQTNFYTATCSSSFDTYMRDLDFAPDGSYFVVSTTGGFRAGLACDTQARFNTARTGTGITAEWVNTTGGDTTYAVEVTGAAVYVGGHFRWANNPSASDRAGAGAVARDGIAALDPINGMPLSWNPGRTRGVGVFDMLATPTGLWVASDTDRIGNYEYHGRIAFFPLAGGTTVPPAVTPVLPAGIVALGPTAGPSPSPATVRLREFSGTSVGRSSQSAGAITWSTTKAAFMLNGKVYLANSDGSFVSRTFDGTTWGAPVAVNTHDQLVVLSAWRTNVTRLTGAFFDNGRIYYTQTNDSALKTRYFTPENSVVGAAEASRATVAGLNLTLTRGMFLAGDSVYLIQSSGSLVKVGWQNGAFVPGTVVTVSGPTIDGVNWSAAASFVFQGPGGATFNFPPIAGATVDCTHQNCAFSSAGTSDPGGSIASYLWSFGDGTTSAEAHPAHVYTASGTYNVTLTVTDEGGAASTVSIATTVVFVDAAPTAAFTFSCDQRVCAFDASGSTDPEGPLASYNWTFGDGATTTEASPSHTFTSDGAFTVQLTVTDSSGTTATVSHDVAVEYVYADPVADFVASCDSLTCTVDGSTSSDADGALVGYAWDFGGTGTASGVTASHTFPASGSYDVTLTVTDGQGAVSSTTRTVAPVELASKVRFVGAAATNRNSTTHPVVVPAAAEAGDVLLLLFSSNSTTAVVTPPAGWTEVAAPAPNGMTGRAWTKVAAATDPGATVTPTSSAIVKADSTLLVYRGVDQASPVAAVATAYGSTGPYITPVVSTVQNGHLVSYWAVKSNAVNVVTGPDGAAVRATSAGTGSGNIAALAIDSGPLVAGAAGGLSATSSVAGNKAFLLSVVLRPAE